MLTAIRAFDFARAFARVCEKSHGPFICPICGCEVVLRQGNIREHHFAHKPPVTCPQAAGETMQHMQAKLAIYDALAQEDCVTDLDVEKSFGISIADVYAKIRGEAVAIEIQRSTLSVNDIVARTMNYQQLGIAVLWIGLPRTEIFTTKYNPQAWERWCHAAYYGRVYYWQDGQCLRPVHFSPYKIYVEERTYYDVSGDEMVGGGYHRISKRYRTPEYGQPVLISGYFRSINRNAFNSETIHVPPSRLYADTLSKWWK